MKNYLLLCVFSTLFFSTTTLAGGFYVGNGGDIIHCAKNRRFGITKPYALDYFLAHSYMNKQFSIVSVNSLSKSFLRIETLLAEKLPPLRSSFNEFASLILNKDSTKKYHWVKSINLFEIPDEGEVINPKNCWDEYYSMGKIEQAIIRQVVSAKEHKIRFLYDANLLSDLKLSSSLQYSFLLVHEWLRNFTNNPETIRRVNYYLHSKQFSTDTPNKIKARLENFNLTLVLE